MSRNACSLASCTFSAPAASRSKSKPTLREAGTTAIAILPSSVTITVFASSLPRTCAKAAISWAVYAGEWLIATYLIFRLSRNSLSILTGMVWLLRC